jgi:hypothetical protein
MKKSFLALFSAAAEAKSLVWFACGALQAHLAAAASWGRQFRVASSERQR